MEKCLGSDVDRSSHLTRNSDPTSRGWHLASSPEGPGFDLSNWEQRLLRSSSARPCVTVCRANIKVPVPAGCNSRENKASPIPEPSNGLVAVLRRASLNAFLKLPCRQG